MPRAARAAHQRDPGLRDHATDRDTYDTQIAARAPYQLKHKDGPDADGYQRLSCPAAGDHPRLICPLRETSLSPRDGRAKIFQPARRTAENLPPERDHHPARTPAPATARTCPTAPPAWHARYATLRNTIEGLNGYVKDPAHEALAQPARRRVRGIAAQSLFTALLLTAANIRKIRAWRAHTADDKTRTARRHADGAPACRLPPRRLTQPPASATTPPPPSPGSHARTPRKQQPAEPHTPRKSDTATNTTVRPRGHTQKQVTTEFCRHDTGSSVGNPWWGRWDSNPHWQDPKSCASAVGLRPRNGNAPARQTPRSLRSRAT